MKKIIILVVAVLAINVAAFFAYKMLNPSPSLSDLSKTSWLNVCADNSQCKQGVEKHYLNCANSMPYDKPANKADLAEFIVLTKVEMESCLSENIGSAFSVE